MSDAELGNTLDFMKTLWNVAHGMQSRSKRMEQTLGVTGPQRLALRILGRNKAMTPGDLAAELCVHPSTLTGVLRRLESRKLITRVVDKDDRRKAHLMLTSAGKKLDASQAGTVEAAVKRTLARLSVHDVGVVGKALVLLSEELARTDR